MSDDGEHPHDAPQYDHGVAASRGRRDAGGDGRRSAGGDGGQGGESDDGRGGEGHGHRGGEGDGRAGAGRGGRLLGGRLVGGRYRLTERIGSGGMGTVWKAVDQLVEREVAVKQPRLPGGPEYLGTPGDGPAPHPDGPNGLSGPNGLKGVDGSDGADDPESAERQRAAHRLYREARAAARVDHPSAVTIHDVVIEDGHPWIVMEWVRGDSLHEVLRRGALAPAEAARIGLAVVGALHAAHSVGIVHRDVKPANVLLGPHGRVVLTDFGIAHVQGEEALTVSGEFVGSIEFIAPERMSGRTAGPPSDLWSLGVLLHTAVEGRSPFRRTTLESTLAAILAADPPKPEHAGPLGPLILRLLAKDPAERPDADEVTAALEAVAEAPVAEGPTGESRTGESRTAEVHVAGVQEAEAQGAEAQAVEVQRAGAQAAESQQAEAPAAKIHAPAELPAPRDGDGTIRLGSTTAPPAAATPNPATPNPATSNPATPNPRSPGRGTGRLLLVAALTGVLLAGGGVWLGTSLAREGENTETVSDPVTPDPTAGARWIPHVEKAMDAVLSLPAPYERRRARDGEGDRPRTVTYEGEEVVRVRLTQWDEAPASPMEQAKDSTDIVAGDVKSTANYTTTSFHDQEAVLADTTHYLDGTPTRVMELIIRTDDDRMYELRVDMPKGTADEKKGTAVFKGARDRLEIGEPKAG